jgi:hypothetical protein
LGTQLWTGRANQDTSAYIAVNELRDNIGDSDWNAFGKNYQLLISQLLKYEAPDVFEDISFLS